jgi:hypothetical protein
MIQAARVAFLCVALVGCADDNAVQPKAGQLTLKSDGVGLVKKTTALGTSMKLDGQFESAAIARKNADGTVTVECHDDQQHAEAFMSATAAAPAAPELQ